MIRDVWRGTVAGLAGSAVMHGFRLWWEITTGDCPRHAVFGFDREADVQSAQLLYLWFSDERPSEQQAARFGLALHYLYGAVLGSLYAVALPRNNWLGKSGGSPLGALLWLCADEIPISAAGISNPFRRSVASHGSALAAHLLFAATVENTLRAFE